MHLVLHLTVSPGLTVSLSLTVSLRLMVTVALGSIVAVALRLSLTVALSFYCCRSPEVAYSRSLLTGKKGVQGAVRRTAYIR